MSDNIKISVEMAFDTDMNHEDIRKYVMNAILHHGSRYKVNPRYGMTSITVKLLPEPISNTSSDDDVYVSFEELSTTSKIVVEEYERFFCKKHRRIKEDVEWEVLCYLEDHDIREILRGHLYCVSVAKKDEAENICTLNYIHSIEHRWK